jgi:hypothetical protein
LKCVLFCGKWLVLLLTILLGKSRVICSVLFHAQ